MLFVASFFHEKCGKAYTVLRSAAFTFFAKRWKSIYSAEIFCFHFFHRFAAKDGKVRTVLRSAVLKFVAAPRKGPALDPGFLIRIVIRDKSFFLPKSRKVRTVLRSTAAKFFMASHSKMEKYVQC